MISEVYNCDCTEKMKQYPDQYFDWGIVDVPYGLNVANMAFLKEKKANVTQLNGTKLNANKSKQYTTGKEWDLKAPSQEYFTELVRITKNQIVFGVEYVDWTGLGKGRIKWNKGVADGMSFKDYELAYISNTDEQIEIDLLWSGMMQAKSLKEPMTQQGNKKLNEKRIHPTHKPILLYLKIYQLINDQNIKVIDTHLGGGSNRIAADMFGVKEFVATELDKEYFDKHTKRWNDYKSQGKLDFPSE